MDQTSPISDPVARAASSRLRPRLAVVDARLQLAHPAGDVPQEWRDALVALLDWLGIAAEIGPASGGNRAEPALFAPWLGWSPAAFQHGGLAGLPQALFAASYLIDHPRGAPPGLGGLDLILLSPHPAHCVPAAADADAVAVPHADMLAAMIRTACAQGRKRAAIIATAGQHRALAARLPDKRESMTLDLLTIEEALPILTGPRPPWDAVIAMPDLRSTVFTLLAHAAGLGRAWPMLWFAGESALRLVTSETPGEGMRRLPLDAPALVHTLALMLNAAGAERPAARLHEAWALLRDSGVTTPGQGHSASPYASAVSDSAFIAMLCRGDFASKRPQQPWRALQNDKFAICGSQIPFLRVIAENQILTSG